jgi:hypothetical protein
MWSECRWAPAALLAYCPSKFGVRLQAFQTTAVVLPSTLLLSLVGLSYVTHWWERAVVFVAKTACKAHV